MTGNTNPDTNVPGANEATTELNQKIASLETEKNNLVGELKEDRQKRQALQDQINELQQALTDATKRNTEAPATGDISALVEQAVSSALNKSTASKAKGNKQAAFEKFVSDHKEFSAENDVTGKRLEALKSKFARFNTEDVVELDDFYALIGDANRLLGGDTTPQTSGREVNNPYSSTPSTNSSPRTAPDNDLSAAELKLIEKNNFTKERYLKLKAKNPKYIESLLVYVR